jgi:hypothetical protein
MPLEQILMILAVICFVLAAVGVPATRVNLVALGLALWAMTLVIAG